MSTAAKLVVGASGFLGSHVVKQLVARGENVRVLLRPTSSTRAIDGLPVERHYGDIFDRDALRAAMAGCDVVHYCVVDARPWLRDPSPMWRTNVVGLRHVLDIAVEAELRRFVFTSSACTIGLAGRGNTASEQTAHNWPTAGGDYVRSRVQAEEMVLHDSRWNGLPGVAMCVSNTYGAGDWLPTPHGGMVSDVIRGRMPFHIKTVEDGAGLPQHTLVTPRTAEVIHELDRERLALAGELDVSTISFWEFLETSYGVTDGTYVERIEQGYGRQAFPEPDSLAHRYFTEDIPFGLVIWNSLARQIGLSLPLTESFIQLSSVLCGRDWETEGRTADVLGLEGADAEQIRTAFRDGGPR